MPTDSDADTELRIDTVDISSSGDHAFRNDLGELSAPVETPEGWMRVDGRLARTGVQVYMNLDGSLRRELRLPEEVFKADAMQSFALVPLTNDHPPVGYLNKDNTKTYAVGAVGESIRKDGEHVRAAILVTDAAAIADLKSGKQELSCGYFCRLERVSGEYNGQRYDAIQRDIRGNHVALVAKGRAGPSARVRVDAAELANVGFEVVTDSHSQSEQIKMEKIVIDGLELEAPKAVVQAFNKFAQARADELRAAKSETDKQSARADAAAEEIKKLEAARADAADPKKFAAAVAARVALEGEARKHLGTETKLDELDARGVKCAVLAKLSPEFKADGKSDDYVSARYDAAIESAGKRNPGLEAARAAAGAPPAPAGTRNDSAVLSEKDAMAKMRNDYANAWKSPAGGEQK